MIEHCWILITHVMNLYSKLVYFQTSDKVQMYHYLQGSLIKCHHVEIMENYLQRG